jgi:hypothetical protein
LTPRAGTLVNGGKRWSLSGEVSPDPEYYAVSAAPDPAVLTCTIEFTAA